MSPTGQGKLRVAFETLGCRSNFADTVDLQLACAEKGAVPTQFSAEADVYVINTCTVTDGADKDVRKIVRRLRERDPQARIVITGCLAEVEEGRSFAEEGGFQVIGTGRRKQVVEAIFADESRPAVSEPVISGPVTSNPAISKLVIPKKAELTVKEQKQRKSISLDQKLPDFVPGPHGALGEVEMRSRFHLRVQEGCDSSCTYCIIPRTRGTLSSRPLADVLIDARKIHAAGYSEVVLTGTHLGGYGEDAGTSLAILLGELLALDLPLRYRLSSLDPNDVSSELLDVWQASDRVCRHFHICLQALDDRILKRMNRSYSVASGVDLLREVRRRLPRAGIGTDLITGFPGEDRDCFQRSLELFSVLPLTYAHIFPYSERAGTAATRLDEEVEAGERKRRSARLRAEVERKRREYGLNMIGQSVDIVIEGEIEHSGAESSSVRWLTGTSGEYLSAAMKFDHKVAVLPEFGTIVRARISDYDKDTGRSLCDALSPV